MKTYEIQIRFNGMAYTTAAIEKELTGSVTRSYVTKSINDSAANINKVAGKTVITKDIVNKALFRAFNFFNIIVD